MSARGLTLDVGAFALPLSSPAWSNGYLPSDAPGDMFYRRTNGCSVGVLLLLLYGMFVTHRNTYQEDAGAFSVVPAVHISLALAAIIHVYLKVNPHFDTRWMA